MLNKSSSRPRYLSSLLISLMLVVCFVQATRAQSALDGFDPSANGPVWAVVVQSDGKILIGGDFTIVQGVSRNRIARLNPDGSLDTAFNPNANAGVRSIAVQADGKILAGGFFSGAGGIGGQTRNYIARLDATTGLADPSFDPNANSIILSIAVQANGGVLVGGAFTSIGGQMRNNIARLAAATGQADSFNPNANSTVLAIAVVGGKILVGGAFSGANSIGGQTRNYIARFDAATGAIEAWDPNANFSVRSFAVQADGKILAGGDFSGANSIGGQARNRIARLDATTGLADSFNPNASAPVAAIVVQPDGKILVGGSFNSIGGQSRASIARFNSGGTLENSFDPNPNGQVAAIAAQADGKILTGGNFTTLAPNGGVAAARNNIARLESGGALDDTFDPTVPGSVLDVAVQPDGKIVVAFLSSPSDCYIGRLDVEGILEPGFLVPVTGGLVYSLALQGDGRILVGGGFFNIGGQPLKNLARLNSNGTVDTGFNPNPNSFVNAIAVQADGRILVGGQFAVDISTGAFSIGGARRDYIARLNAADGAADSFDPDANGPVRSIAVQADGKILVGGHFNGSNSIGGQARNRVARLDAATGLADSLDPNANVTVTEIVVQADGKILVAGDFNGLNSIGGQTRNRIARLDATTGLADSFNPNPNNTVLSLAVQADGKILVGGHFNGTNSIGGATRNRIARLNAADGMADSFDPNSDDYVRCITAQSDGEIIASGSFTNIGGQARDGFARLSNDTAALQNLNVTQTTVTWTRSGSSPHLSRVTFESSTDNINYTALGSGTAAGTIWTLTGLSLPTGQNIYIRSRGFYQGGEYNGTGSITESVQNAFITPGFSITGTITYGNAIGNPAPPRFVKNVSVASTAGSPGVGPAITGTPGTYVLTGFGAGSYTIKPTKPGGPNAAINSFDAARVAQGVSGTIPFVSQNQRFVSDASGNGSVTSNDAALIAKFAAGLGGAGNVGQWKFFVTGAPSPLPTAPQTYSDSRTYASISSSLTGEDFVALLIGEASGSWNPATHPRPALGPEKNISVEIPRATASTDKEIIIPVNVQGTSGKDVISYEFELRYDPTVIQPLAEPFDVTRTLSRALMVVTNPNEPGLLKIIVYGPMPIEGDGVLLNLRFAAVGKPGSVSPLRWERVMFNEGEPRVSTTDGRIELF
jgi:uncharacterized delta-60 repeat protein